MPEDRLALSEIPQALPEEAEYDAICSTVTATARGRWFLEEYARRHRQADTAKVLAAMERLESVTAEAAEAAAPDPAPEMSQQGVAAVAGRLRDMAHRMCAQGIQPEVGEQLGELAQTILLASSLHDPADPRAQKLTEVLQYLEFRIDQMLDSHAGTAQEEVAEAPSAAVQAEQTTADVAVVALDAMAVVDTRAAVVDEAAAGAGEEPAERVADMVAAVAPTDEEISEPTSDVAATVEAGQRHDVGADRLSAQTQIAAHLSTAMGTAPVPAPAFVELDLATFARRLAPVILAPESESPAAPVADTGSELPPGISSLQPEASSAPTEPQSAEVCAQTPPEVAPPEDIRAAVIAPEVVEPTLLRADADDGVVIVDVDTLLSIEFGSEGAAVEPVAETLVQTNDTAEVAVAVAEATADGDTVANQVNQDLDVLGRLFTPEAAARNPAATQSEFPQQPPGQKVIAEGSQAAAETALNEPTDSRLAVATATPREQVPSMWGSSTRAQAPHEDPADFLLEPLSTSSSTPSPQATAAAPANSPPAAAQPRAKTQPTPRAGGPLAALAAMSDEERIALFT